MRQLSSDFVIRANQSGYTSERTTMNVYYQGQEHEYNLRPGDRIVFADDAQVDVREGSLMLLSTTSEKRLLTLRDISLPLLPGDKIVTDKNGSVDISFPDGTQTTLTQNQHWTLDVYDPEIGIFTHNLKDKLILEVRDKGIGIQEEDISKIYFLTILLITHYSLLIKHEKRTVNSGWRLRNCNGHFQQCGNHSNF